MSLGIPSNNATGYVHNLTADQETKLRELWVLIFKSAASVLAAVYEVELPEGPPNKLFEVLDRISEPTVDAVVAALNGEKPNAQASNGDAPAEGSNAESKEQASLEKVEAPTNKDVKNNIKAELGTKKITPEQLSSICARLRKMGVHESETKSMGKILSTMNPVDMCFAVLKLAKQENPDSLLLRFLRARKWDVGKGFTMLIQNILWRKEFDVDDDILPKGELHELERSRNDELSAKEKKDGKDFVAQLDMGKSFLHGFDKQGRPVSYVRVKIHKPGAQTEETLERYIVHVIESTRLLVVPPVETVTIVFDMTGFSLSNMEYQPVKFIIECYEANYPESLGLLLIHNAPWIFSSIWRLIHGWMDPVVASKVHFTKSVDDLDKFISRDQIPREFNGDEDWSYRYIEPETTENDIMKDTETRNSLMYERTIIGLNFLACTAAWISATTFAQGEPDKANVDQLQARRTAIIEDFRRSYWRLDPYVRARALIDRSGTLKPDGTVVTEAEKNGAAEPNGDAKVNGGTAAHIEVAVNDTTV